MLPAFASRLGLLTSPTNTTALLPLVQRLHGYAVPHPIGDGQPRTVTLIPGDGVGPEITKSVVDVVEALHAPIIFERFDDFKGSSPNIPKEVLESIRRNGVALKGTLVTPLEKRKADVMSLNLQLRQALDFHVNLVHGMSIPGLEGRHKDLNIVVIRENTEGEYSGLEHEVVDGVIEAIKVITYEKSLRTAQYAFEFALLNNREKVTAVHKANIMKLGDGMFLQACRSVAPNFPSIKFEEMIVDNTCMQLVNRPEQFDVMVTPNLYGSLVSNIVTGLCGGPGVVPGANIGDGVALFEAGARHSARDLAGKGTANPTATLLAASGMMHHLRLPTFAERLEEAILEVYAAGNAADLTPDVGGTGTLHSMTKAIIAKLL